MRRFPIGVSLSVALWCAWAGAGSNRWTTTGPYGGSVMALAADPITPGTVYASNVGVGVFKTCDGGATWLLSAAGMPADYFGGPLAVDPVTPSTIYAGAGRCCSGPDVFKSTDGGSTWLAAGAGLPNGPVESIAVDGLSPDTVYAAYFDGGVFKSTDAGATWRAANVGLPPSSGAVEALALDPRSPGTLYAAHEQPGPPGVLWNGISRTTNAAASWTIVAENVCAEVIDSLVVDPSSPGVLFFSAGDEIHRSEDGGVTWSVVFRAPAGAAVRALTVQRGAPATVWAATSAGPWCSRDGGTSWTGVAAGLGVPSSTAVAVDAAAPAAVYLGTAGGGVFVTRDGARWAAASTGMTGMGAGALAAAHRTPNVFAGAGGVAFVSADGGATWTPEAAGLGELGVASLAVDPSAPGTVWAGTTGGIFRSNDGAASWNAVWPSLDTAERLVVDASDPRRVYAVMRHSGGSGVFYSYVVRTDDGGETWRSSPPSSFQGPSDVALDPASPTTLFVAAAEVFLKSNDAGASWTTVDSFTFPELASRVAVAAEPAAAVYVGTSTGVVKSVDGGVTWAPAGRGLGCGNVRALAVDPSSPAVVYAGTLECGVFRTANGGGVWEAVNAGLPDAPVFALAVNPNQTDTVFAATGAGVYSIRLAPGHAVRRHLHAAAN